MAKQLIKLNNQLYLIQKNNQTYVVNNEEGSEGELWSDFTGKYANLSVSEFTSESLYTQLMELTTNYTPLDIGNGWALYISAYDPDNPGLQAVLANSSTQEIEPVYFVFFSNQGTMVQPTACIYGYAGDLPNLFNNVYFEGLETLIFMDAQMYDPYDYAYEYNLTDFRAIYGDGIIATLWYDHDANTYKIKAGELDN